MHFIFFHRSFFENQDQPPEPKPIVRRTTSNEWKPKPAPQESVKKPVSPPAAREKPAYVKPKPKEPQNQADLVKIALAQQAGPVKPDLQRRPRSISAPPQESVRS